MIIRMARLGLLFSTFALLSFLTAAQAHAQGRIALVVGNSDYQHVPVLANPANDAADVAQALQRLGFSVTTVKNANYESLRRALLDLGRAARNAEMAMLFFAGHGTERAGENWLLPIDSELKNDIDLDTEAISLRSAIQAVSNAKLLGLVVLDACRSNSFALKARKVAGPAKAFDFGLAPVEPAENVLVAYAARDGTTASDGSGRNSPYTTALLHHLETPGLEIEFLFRNVRDDVMTATNDEQQPFIYGSLSREEIYLKDAPPVVMAMGSSDVMSDAGEIAWSFLRTTSDVGTLRRFVEQFPASSRLSDAKVRIAALDNNTDQAQPAAGGFMLASTSSVEVDPLELEATRPFRRNTPAVEAAWDVVKETKDVNVVRRFVDRFPTRQRRAAVDRRLTEIGEQRQQRGLARDVTRDNLLRAATDDDVLRCFRLDDIYAPECRRALERYPLISQFTFDFRFRFALCRSLGSDCRGPDNMSLMRDTFGLQAKALFNPGNADPARTGIAPGANPGQLNAAGGNAGQPGQIGVQSVTTGTGGTAGTTGPGANGPKHFFRAAHVTHHPTSADPATKAPGDANAGNKSKLGRSHKLSAGSRFKLKTGDVKIKDVKVKDVKVTTRFSKLTTGNSINAIKNVGVKNVNIKTVNVKTVNVKVPTVRVPTINVRIPH